MAERAGFVRAATVRAFTSEGAAAP
jgi:hypothetical protein